MDALEILTDAFARVDEEVPALVDGLSTDQLLWQPDPGANHLAWLLWHIGRGEDSQMAALGKRSQVYASGWAARFRLPYGNGATGYGQTAEQVRAFRLDDPALLTGYYRAVHQATASILGTLTPESLDDLVDDPFHVTVGVRLVSIVNDATQHLGQAAYLHGLVVRR